MGRLAEADTELRVGAVRVVAQGGNLSVRRHALANAGRTLGIASVVLFAGGALLAVASEPFAYVFVAGILGGCTSLVYGLVAGSERASAPGMVVMHDSFEVFRAPKREAEGYRDAPEPAALHIELDGRPLAERVVDVRVHQRWSSSAQQPTAVAVYVVCESFVVLVAASLDRAPIKKLHDLLRSALGLPAAGVGSRSEAAPGSAAFWMIALGLVQVAVVFGGCFYAFYLADHVLRDDPSMQAFVLAIGSATAIVATFVFPVVSGNLLARGTAEWVRDTFRD